MAMKPVTAWHKDYQPRFESAFKGAVAGIDVTQKVWGQWVNANAQGIEVAPPYKSTGSMTEFNFSDPSFFVGGTVVQAATALANSWKAWYLAIKFTKAPPTPPFSEITAVTPSPAGVALAYTALLTGLIAEMLLLPPDPKTAFLLKGVAFGTLFNTACLTAGVEIDGLGIGSPPPPLTVPLVPVL